MKMHLPVTVATDPDSSDICIPGHCASATGCGFIGMVNDGSDVGGKNAHVGIDESHWGKRTLLMELLDEGKDLIAGPDFLFDIGEAWLEECGEVCDVASGVGSPEGIFLRDNHVRRTGGLSKYRQSEEQ